MSVITHLTTSSLKVSDTVWKKLHISGSAMWKCATFLFPVGRSIDRSIDLSVDQL